MPGPLRLHALALSVPDTAAADSFYRWTFRLEDAPEGAPPRVLNLGWGKEDRVRLVEGGAEHERVGLRMPATPLNEALAWCAERDLETVALSGPAPDVESAARELPEAAIEPVQDARLQNLVRVTARGWAGFLLDLTFPVPMATLVQRGAAGPFLWRGGDWSGLETPGLLGVTLAGPDLAAGRAFWGRLGSLPLEEGSPDGGPLRIGDQQLILEEREQAAIPGAALLVGEARLGEVTRTLAHLGAEFRQSGNRVLARDPAGRVVVVQGIRGG